MGAHKGQATTPYFFDLDALSVGAHGQTDHVQHQLASTSNNVEALAKGGEEEERRVSVEEHAHSGEEGRSWDASRDAEPIHDLGRRVRR